MNTLDVTWCIQPGRFPTVIHDPGLRWDELSRDPRVDLRTLETLSDKRLQRENARLREESEILKKATAFFVDESK